MIGAIVVDMVGAPFEFDMGGKARMLHFGEDIQDLPMIQ